LRIVLNLKGPSLRAKQSISDPSSREQARLRLFRRCERSEPRRMSGPAGGRRPSRRAQERAPQGDGSRYASVLSRRDAPEVCKIIRPKSKRAQGMPGACCTRGPVCKSAKKTHTSIQVQTEHSGIPCAMVLRLIPRSPRRRIPLASVADGLKDCRNPVGSTRLRQLDTSNGCQDHTALPYAASPVIRTLCSLTDQGPPGWREL
jgi:hypothetical protein